LDGEIVQHVEYVPFGEVFIEERNNVWNTPYLFNAKELDEETGLYYYGARYYDARISLWLSTDPLQEKYPNVSTYAYTFQNPIRYIDPTGMEGEDGDPNKKSGGFLNSLSNALRNFFFGDNDAKYIEPEKRRNGRDVAEYQIQQLTEGQERAEQTAEYVNNTADMMAIVHPLGSTIKTGVSLDRGEEVDAIDIAFSSFEIITLGCASEGGGLIKYGLKGINWGRKASIGFRSFSAFKRYYGAAGKGRAWHHIVEQTTSNISKFGSENIHNIDNVINIDHGAGSLHAKVSGYYSSIQPTITGSSTMTVRQWLSGKSYQEQYNFGIGVLKKFGWSN
jgi:RHS repeat-associated protein